MTIILTILMTVILMLCTFFFYEKITSPKGLSSQFKKSQEKAL